MEIYTFQKVIQAAKAFNAVHYTHRLAETYHAEIPFYFMP